MVEMTTQSSAAFEDHTRLLSAFCPGILVLFAKGE